MNIQHRTFNIERPSCGRGWAAAGCVISILALSARLVAAGAGEPPDWWRAKSEVSRALEAREGGIAGLVDEARTGKTGDAQAAMRRLYVFMRAAMEEDAVGALKEVKSACPDLVNYQVASIYYAACDDYQAWDLARKTVEIFADTLSEVALQNRLLRHMEESGWGFERIDVWLAGKPEGMNSFWLKERLAFQARHGRAEALITEWANQVRADPDDVRQAITLLEALAYTRAHADLPHDLAWMAETIRPRFSTEAERMGSLLKQLDHAAAASTFFRQAMHTPLTEEEVERRVMMYQAMVPPAGERIRFSIHAREQLAACLLTMGDAEEAQQEMEKARALRKQHGMEGNALLAGRIQAASGDRVVEAEILDEEDGREDDPAYWLRRADYYHGRHEPEREEDALKKALARTEPLSPRRGKVPADRRALALSRYAHFLKGAGRQPEAVELLRTEMNQAPAASASSQAAARLLAFEFVRYLDPGDEVLWTWLAAQPEWEHREQRLLWRMLEQAGEEERDVYFTRAEDLARRGALSRAATLGWILNRMSEPERSLPLLERAAIEATDEETREQANFTLLESYLDLRDWRNAEAVFPEARKRLTAREATGRHGRIAIAAAESGDKDDAVRIWKEVAEAAPTEIHGLERLVRLGLGDAVRPIYEEMAETMPGSTAPARALEIIDRED